MSFSLFIARRLYKNTGKSNKRGTSLLALRIATAGVAIGLAIMIISICVVKGFQSEIRSKLSGFASHIEILNLASFASPEDHPIDIPPQFKNQLKSVDKVEHVAPVSMKMGILKTNTAFQTIVLKGVDESYTNSFIKNHVIAGRLPFFSDKKSSNEILISHSQASKLKLKIGSKVFAYFISDEIRMRRFKIVGIYETNLAQFDDNFVWTDRATVNKLNRWTPEQASDIEIRLKNFDDITTIQPIVKNISKTYKDDRGQEYETLSIKENPRTAAITQWLSLLDLNVWVILALMMGVAGFTMVSGLLILILERTSTIGILKSLGSTNRTIRYIFIEYSSLILIRGLFYGNLIGFSIVLLQKYCSLISLDPSTYYVTVAPVEIPVIWIIGINMVTIIITILAMIVPSYIISHIRPTKAIRFE